MSLLLLAYRFPQALVHLAPPPPQRMLLKHGVAWPSKLHQSLMRRHTLTYQHEEDHARQHYVHCVGELLCLETHDEGEDLSDDTC